MEDMKNYAYTLFRTIPSRAKITYLFLRHRAAISPFMMVNRGEMDVLLFVGYL